MLFVPANYFHRQDSPSNNKFFRLWGDSYSAANKVGASSFPEASGSSHLAFEYNYEGWSDGTLGTGPSSVAGAKSTTTAFGTDATRGRWIQVRIHARHVSGPSARDGRLRMWVNGQLVISFENVPQKFDSARPYWNAGYLFGWANSGFSEETLFFVDDVRFFASSPGW
jgi:hypothetical protein